MTIPYTRDTWVDNTTDATAARMNNLEAGVLDAHLQPAVRAYHNANQNILTTATWVTIALNSERFDTAGGAASTQHDNSTNNSRLTCRYAGKYLIIAQAQIEGTNAGTARGLRVRLNATTTIGMAMEIASAFPATGDTNLIVTTLYDLAVNDYVEMQGYQESGATRNVYASANQSPEFMMVRVA